MFRRTLLCAAIAATVNANAADFSNTYFFGDSLSDAGTFSPFLPPGLGKFTTNPGPVWTENVGAALGTDARPAVLGGTDYAQGGARVSRSPGVPAIDPLAGLAQPIRTQVSTYLAGAGTADSRALYTVWGGANDIFQAIDPTAPEAADPVGYLLTTAAELSGEVGRLRAAGARYVLVPNVPDIGVSPFGLSLGAGGSAAVSGLVQAYNQALFANLAAAGQRVIPLDAFTLLNEVLASPTTYGFANITGVACGATRAYVCGPGDLVAPNADQTFLFADGVHPTTAGHRVISDYALSVLRAPSAISLLAESPLETRAQLLRTIHDQAAVVRRAEAPTGSHLWGSAGSGRLKYESTDALAGATGDPMDLAIGLDHRLTPQFTLGAAVAASRIRPHFAGGGGKYQQDENAFAVYAVYRRGGWHASAIGAVGRLEFDTSRVVALGPASRSMEGSTSGSNRSLGLVVGFDSTSGPLKHGPVVGWQAQRITVDGFTERSPAGEGSTAMAFSEQKRESRVGSLGYQIAYAGPEFTPYARLTIDREFEDDERQVGATLQTMAGNSFELPAVTPDRNTATAIIGLGIRLTPAVGVNLSATARRGEDTLRAFAAQAALSVGF